MTTTNNMVLDTVIASADLSALQYRVVGADGDLAAHNGEAFGVLQNKPLSGEHASVATRGQVKAYAGAAIAANVGVSCTASGFVITTASGSGVSIGKNGNVSVGSGDVFKFQADFANASNIT